MAAVIPTSLKIVTAVLRRAEELERDTNRDSQIVAYYCRVYVVTKGSKICGADPEAGRFLMSQMELLEKIKPTLNITKEQGEQTCRAYAATVFNKADEEDRAGVADKATAKLFYSAGTFFDILDQFGEMDAETIDKRKYSKWKATDILNAIRLGKKPSIGGIAEDMGDMSLDDSSARSAPVVSSSGGGYDIPSAPVGASLAPPPAGQRFDIPPAAPFSVSPIPLHPMVPHSAPSAPPSHMPPPQQQQQQNFHQNQQQQPPSPAVNGYARPGYTASPIPATSPVNNADPRVKDTIELCSFAIAALKHNEVALARDRLTEALRRLQ